MPLAYSYLRFSSPQQAAGDSLRRQTAAREAWLAAHPGVQLDQSLVMTDAGRSAYKRDDWDAYALARFVEHIKARRVEPGSYLLVENLDRLSRENAGEATELFLSIVNKGVVVVQLAPIVMEFRRPVNMHSLMFAILELSRGHSESAAKSERVGAAWARKQSEAATRVVTRRLPGWIRYADGKLTADPAAAGSVRRIFELARDGSGVATIARTLNAERVPVIGRKTFKGRSVAWSSSTIYQILTSRAVIGDYVPYKCRGAGRKTAGEPIPNYFPTVIGPDTFHAVQGLIARRATSGRGRRGKHVNIFAGLLANARDGGSLTYRHHSTQPATLVPVDVKSGRTKATWVSFPAAVFEDAVLDQLAEIKAADVAGDGRATRRVAALSGEVAEVDNLIKLWSAKMDNPATVDVVAAKLADYAGRRKKLSEELADAQREAASPLSESWGEFRSLAALLRKDGSDEMRLKVRASLRRSIESVTCLFVGSGRYRMAAVRVDFRGSGCHRDYVVVHRYTPGRRPKAGRPPRPPMVFSFADVVRDGEFDLRDPKQAKELEPVLVRVLEEVAARLKSGGEGG